MRGKCRVMRSDAMRCGGGGVYMLDIYMRGGGGGGVNGVDGE